MWSDLIIVPFMIAPQIFALIYTNYVFKQAEKQLKQCAK